MAEKPIAALIEKIAKECEGANADKWTIAKIVKQLSLEEASSVKSLRKKALELLQQLDPKAAAVYASFQRMQVRTSRQVVEGFDRGNIIKSLLKETDVARGVAEKIGHEVEEKIKDLEISDISTALIREMVNVKLLEYGHENIRNQYARIGLPVFEVKKKIQLFPYDDRAIMSEYNLLRVIPGRLARMHLSGEIFIAELQDFGTKPIAISFVPEAGENPKETVFSAVEKANALEKFFSWRPNISALNAAISANAGKKAAKESALLFARAAKAAFLRKKAVPAFNTSYLFEPAELAKKETEREPMAVAANAMLNEKETWVFENAVAVDSKFKLKLLHSALPKTVLNCKNEEWRLLNGIALQKQGICSFFALNLSAVALRNAESESGFFESLREKANAIALLDELKRKELAQKEYLKKKGIPIEEYCSVLALDSLLEAGKTAIAAEKESEAISFCEKTLEHLAKALPKSFVLAELRNSGAFNRFSAQNRKNFRAEAKRVEEEKQLKKSAFICKNYCFSAKAQNKKELNELLESNARIIECCETRQSQ